MSAARRMLWVAPGVRVARRGRLALASLIVLAAGVGPVAAQTEVIAYYGQDALGSIRMAFDVTGIATARADFEPFGELFTVPGMPGGSLWAPLFTGQERDPEASQDYFGARYYQPRVGRFSQVDPVFAGLFDPQQWNRYAYVRNSPLSFVDPDGRQVVECRPGVFCATAQPPTESNPGNTAAQVEGIAALNNSCWGEGNSRACGNQERSPKEPSRERASYLATLADDFLDAQPPGDAVVIELALLLVEENLKIVATGLIVPSVAAGAAQLGIGGSWIRFGPTQVPNQLIYGNGVPGSTLSTWGIKGGGPGMPYHFHIHDFNWNRPLDWFKNTPTVPRKWRY